MSVRRSRIYEQLNTEKRKTLSNTNFGYATDNIHIEGPNVPELEDTALIGYTANKISSSGPIPGTGRIESVSGSYSSGTYVDLFTPESGSCYQIISADFNCTLSSGTVDSVQLYVTVGGSSVMIGENTGDNFDTFRDIFSGPITIDENMTVQARASDANITALAVRLLLIRVR